MSEITDGYILDHWITVQEAATRLSKTEQNVTAHCRKRNLEARRITRGKRSFWMINPDSLGNLRVYRRRR